MEIRPNDPNFLSSILETYKELLLDNKLKEVCQNLTTENRKIFRMILLDAGFDIYPTLSEAESKTQITNMRQIIEFGFLLSGKKYISLNQQTKQLQELGIALTLKDITRLLQESHKLIWTDGTSNYVGDQEVFAQDHHIKKTDLTTVDFVEFT